METMHTVLNGAAEASQRGLTLSHISTSSVLSISLHQADHLQSVCQKKYYARNGLETGTGRETTTQTTEQIYADSNLN